jgi:hypothetical protein
MNIMGNQVTLDTKYLVDGGVNHYMPITCDNQLEPVGYIPITPKNEGLLFLFNK